jgi:hypothetical protein
MRHDCHSFLKNISECTRVELDALSAILFAIRTHDLDKSFSLIAFLSSISFGPRCTQENKRENYERERRLIINTPSEDPAFGNVRFLSKRSPFDSVSRGFVTRLALLDKPQSSQIRPESLIRCQAIDRHSGLPSLLLGCNKIVQNFSQALPSESHWTGALM